MMDNYNKYNGLILEEIAYEEYLIVCSELV